MGSGGRRHRQWVVALGMLLGMGLVLRSGAPRLDQRGAGRGLASVECVPGAQRLAQVLDYLTRAPELRITSAAHRIGDRDLVVPAMAGEVTAARRLHPAAEPARTLAERWREWREARDFYVSQGPDHHDPVELARLSEGLADIAIDLGYYAEVVSSPPGVRLVRYGDEIDTSTELGRFLAQYVREFQTPVGISERVIAGKTVAAFTPGEEAGFFSMDLDSFITQKPSREIVDHEVEHSHVARRERVLAEIARLTNRPTPQEGRTARRELDFLDERAHELREAEVLAVNGRSVRVRTVHGEEVVGIAELATARVDLPFMGADGADLDRVARFVYRLPESGTSARRSYDRYRASDEVEAFTVGARSALNQLRFGLRFRGSPDSLRLRWRRALAAIRAVIAFSRLERADLNRILQGEGILEAGHGMVQFTLPSGGSVLLRDPRAPVGPEAARREFAYGLIRQRLQELDRAVAEVDALAHDIHVLEPQIQALP